MTFTSWTWPPPLDPRKHRKGSQPRRRNNLVGAGKCQRIGVMALVWLLYFGVLLLIALPQGLNTAAPETVFSMAKIGLWEDTDAWIRAFGPHDPASYAKAGREIATEGWLKNPHDILWPPGEFLLHAALDLLH